MNLPAAQGDVQLIGFTGQRLGGIEVALGQGRASLAHFFVRLRRGVGIDRWRSAGLHLHPLAKHVEALFVRGTQIQLVGRDLLEERGGVRGPAMLEGGLREAD